MCVALYYVYSSHPNREIKTKYGLSNAFISVVPGTNNKYSFYMDVGNFKKNDSITQFHPENDF